jgi:hypothetical protein
MMDITWALGRAKTEPPADFDAPPAGAMPSGKCMRRSDRVTIPA